MNTQLRTAASIVVFGLFSVASTASLAGPVETQFSVYDIAERQNQTQTQAGPAGPSRLPSGNALSNWPVESQFSVYHLASQRDNAQQGQAGRGGPVTISGPSAEREVSETMYSIYDLSDRI